MDTPRIRMGHPYGETPPNCFTDYEWVREHERELLDRYGECSIIVYRQQVIGVGETRAAALADAERKLPPDSGEITPIHERLHRRLPFFRVYPQAAQDNQ